MNNTRRKEIDKVYDKIALMVGDIESICLDEEMYMENIPESLQGSRRYEVAEEAVDNLRSAIDSINEALSYLQEAQL